MRKLIAINIGYPLQDLVNGTNILKTLKFLKISQYWDETRIYEYQLKKLKNLIDYAIRNVPYYENIFNKIKLTSNDIRTFDDISKIPILTKEILRKENNRLISRTFSRKYANKGKTGGTTGPPVIVYKDIYNRSLTWASYFRWYEWMDINYYDPITSFWGAQTVLNHSYKTKVKDSILYFIQNKLVFNSFNMNEENFLSIYNTILKQKPVLIKGYLSSILHFAKFIDEQNLDIIKLKAISTTTETLLPHNREYLEQIFKVPIFDQYGCGEISAISYECPRHNGLHINQEHVICEIHDESNKTITNKSGRVIATDLDNLVMPFIRYENGDMATITDTKCACGVNQPLMKSIEGRSVDTITLKDGNKVHGVFFTDILYELGILTNQIQKFQVYQKELGKIEFRFEVNKPLEKEIYKKMEKSLSRFFNDVIIVEKKKLVNEDNGKFRYIINKINTGNI